MNVNTRAECKITLSGSFEGSTMKHLYRILHLARLTDRYRAMSHAGMTTAWPPQQPPEKLKYQPVNTGRPGWSTCLSTATPSSLQVSRTHMHPHKHPNTRTHWEYSLWSPVGADTEEDCQYHTSEQCFIGVITSPRAMIPLPPCDKVSGTLGTQTGPCAPMSCLPK